MDLTTTVVIAHPSADERRRLALALQGAGITVLSASNGEEVLRTSVGSDPDVVVTHSRLPGLPGVELRTRLAVTGLEIPPILVVAERSDDVPGELPEGVYVVPAEQIADDGLIDFLRRILLAADLRGEFSAGGAVLHGDLARTSFGDLVQALERHRVRGRLEIASSVPAGLWLADGRVVDAWYGSIEGRKAFHRLAGLQSSAWSLTDDDPGDRDSIAADAGSLVLEAVEERVATHEALQELPSLDARPRVQLGDRFFQLEFSPVERQVMASVQQVTTLAELVDRVPASDREVLEAIHRLHALEILSLVEPAGRVHVLTDSTADLSVLDARRHGVEIVPVSIVFGSEVFMDGIDISPDEFHRRIGRGGELPVTNPATRGEFLSVYRRVVPTGDVLAVLCSSRLSGSYDNARAAAEDGLDELRALRRERQVQAEPRIRILDSGQCSGPLGMMAVLATRLLKGGASLEETARRVESIGRRFTTLLTVTTLEFLRRGQSLRPTPAGGRPAAGTRWVLKLVEGGLEPVDTVIGVEAAHRRMLELAAADVEPDRPVLATVVHASEPAQAAALRGLVERSFRVAELQQHPIGPAVTCNAGPGAVGIGLFQPTDDELELLSV